MSGTHRDLATSMLEMADAAGYWPDLGSSALQGVQQLHLAAIAHALLALTEDDTSKENK